MGGITQLDCFLFLALEQIEKTLEFAAICNEWEIIRNGQKYFGAIF